jgi:hypothetical protein
VLDWQRLGCPFWCLPKAGVTYEEFPNPNPLPASILLVKTQEKLLGSMWERAGAANEPNPISRKSAGRIGPIGSRKSHESLESILIRDSIAQGLGLGGRFGKLEPERKSCLNSPASRTNQVLPLVDERPFSFIQTGSFRSSTFLKHLDGFFRDVTRDSVFSPSEFNGHMVSIHVENLAKPRVATDFAHDVPDAISTGHEPKFYQPRQSALC